jgi:hypothetical protein
VVVVVAATVVVVVEVLVVEVEVVVVDATVTIVSAMAMPSVEDNDDPAQPWSDNAKNTTEPVVRVVWSLLDMTPLTVPTGGR